MPSKKRPRTFAVSTMVSFLPIWEGLGIEERDVRAFVIGSGLEGAAGAGGGLLEEQNDVLAGEQVAADAGALLRLQIGGGVEHIADLIGGEILQREKRTAFEINRHGIVLLQDSSPPMGKLTHVLYIAYQFLKNALDIFSYFSCI